MKVKVRYTSDYRNYPKDTLVSMLLEKDVLIERLQHDLEGARELELAWQKRAATLQNQLSEAANTKERAEENADFCRCSICGFRVSNSAKRNYCPGCGARMGETAAHFAVRILGW